MNKILKLIACYPIEFIILLALIPLILIKPLFVLSSIFLITSVFLLCTIINIKKKPTYLSIYLIFAFFVIYTALILFLDLMWLWFAPLFLSIINIAIIKRLLKKNKIDLFLITNYLKFLLLFVGLIPLLLFIFKFLLQNKEISKATKSSKNIIESNIDKKNLEKNLNNISKEPIIKDLILNGNFKESLPIISTLMHASNLTYLTITDNSGYVRARSHKPDALGDNLFLSNPEIKLVFEGQHIEGYLEIQELPLAYIRGISISNENKIIGAIFGGYLLNDNFAKNIVKNNFAGCIVLTEKGNFGYYSNDPVLNSYLLSIRFDKNFKPFYSTIGKTDYLFLPIKIVNSSDKNIGYFIMVHNSERRRQLSFLLFISITLIILTAGITKKWK